jgi:hypothetical protein
MGKKISKEELSNEQIEQLIEEFANLTEEERQKRLLGKGAYKSAYEIPGKDFVIKKPHYTSEAINDMAREYGVNKRLLDEVDLEPPILVTRKNELGERDPFHIQRRVAPLNDELRETITNDPKLKSFKEEEDFLSQLMKKSDAARTRALNENDLVAAKNYAKDYQDAYSKLQQVTNAKIERRNNLSQPAMELIDKVSEGIEKANLRGADIHEGNITKKGSVFDLGSWVDYIDDDAKSKGLSKMRSNIVKKTISEAKKPTKFGIYRALIPLVAKGALAGATGLASLAAEASDATEEGSSIEEAAMEREKQDRKFRNTVGQDTYNASQKLLRSIGPKDLIDPDAQKSQFRTLRNKLK